MSRNFTFRVQDDESPKKKKKRLRKPDGDDLEEGIGCALKGISANNDPVLTIFCFIV